MKPNRALQWNAVCLIAFQYFAALPRPNSKSISVQGKFLSTVVQPLQHAYGPNFTKTWYKNWLNLKHGSVLDIIFGNSKKKINKCIAVNVPLLSPGPSIQTVAIIQQKVWTIC